MVAVSAIGRAGAPYATDTLLGEPRSVDPAAAPEARELDLMMACGEIISTVIMAHTLKALGYRATALTGGQAGIVTDEVFGDARIVSINPHYDRNLLGPILVAGFQGVTDPERRHGASHHAGQWWSDDHGIRPGSRVARRGERSIPTCLGSKDLVDPESVRELFRPPRSPMKR